MIFILIYILISINCYIFIFPLLAKNKITHLIKDAYDISSCSCNDPTRSFCPWHDALGYVIRAFVAILWPFIIIVELLILIIKIFALILSKLFFIKSMHSLQEKIARGDKIFTKKEKIKEINESKSTYRHIEYK